MSFGNEDHSLNKHGAKVGHSLGFIMFEIWAFMPFTFLLIFVLITCMHFLSIHMLSCWGAPCLGVRRTPLRLKPPQLRRSHKAHWGVHLKLASSEAWGLLCLMELPKWSSLWRARNVDLTIKTKNFPKSKLTNVIESDFDRNPSNNCIEYSAFNLKLKNSKPLIFKVRGFCSSSRLEWCSSSDGEGRPCFLVHLWRLSSSGDRWSAPVSDGGWNY